MDTQRSRPIWSRALVVAGLLLLAVVSTAGAGEWKKLDHKKSKIELHIDWPWVTSERGVYYEGWTDDYERQNYTVSWSVFGQYPRLAIGIERLAPGYVWKRLNIELNKNTLIWWNFLKDRRISDIMSIDCDAKACVTFKADWAYYCGGFVFVEGIISTVDADEGSDWGWGYYCSGTTKEVTTDQLNEIVGSIVIRD